MSINRNRISNIIKDRLKAEGSIVRFGIYSLMVNLTLSIVKFTLSILTGSLALRADAIHSLVDVFASIALILGLVISGRKSRQFPYGLYKVENLIAAIISLLLFFTAYEIVREAVEAEPAKITYGGWVLLVVFVIILVPFFFGRYELNAGKRYNSPSLIADGSQFRADVMGSSIVFLALLGQLFGFPLDRYAAGVVALFIAYAAWGLLTNSMRVLLDASVGYETLEKICSLILSEPAVNTIVDLTARNSGRFIFVEATVTMRVADLIKAHLISQDIEDKIKKAVPNVDRVLIHYEPQKRSQLRYAVALDSSKGEISEHFGEPHYFALIDIDINHKTIHRQEIILNPYREVEKGRGIKVAEFLLGYKPDIVVLRESLEGKGPGYAFSDSGIEVIQTEDLSVDEFLDQIMVSTSNNKQK